MSKTYTKAFLLFYCCFTLWYIVIYGSSNIFMFLSWLKQYFSVNRKYTVRYWAKSTVIVFYFDYCYILRIVFAKLKSRFKVITMVTMMAYFFVAKHANAIKETKWKFTLSTILWLEQFGKCDRLKGIVSWNWRGLQMIYWIN